MMKLYWKDTEIGENTVIYHYGEQGELVRWKVLEIRERASETDYYEPNTGKGYPLKKVLKSRRLSGKQKKGHLLQVPPGKYFLVVEESLVESESFEKNMEKQESKRLRCFNADFLETLKGVRIREM